MAQVIDLTNANRYDPAVMEVNNKMAEDAYKKFKDTTEAMRQTVLKKMMFGIGGDAEIIGNQIFGDEDYLAAERELMNRLGKKLSKAYDAKSKSKIVKDQEIEAYLKSQYQEAEQQRQDSLKTAGEWDQTTKNLVAGSLPLPSQPQQPQQPQQQQQPSATNPSTPNNIVPPIVNPAIPKSIADIEPNNPLFNYLAVPSNPNGEPGTGPLLRPEQTQQQQQQQQPVNNQPLDWSQQTPGGAANALQAFISGGIPNVPAQPPTPVVVPGLGAGLGAAQGNLPLIQQPTPQGTTPLLPGQTTKTVAANASKVSFHVKDTAPEIGIKLPYTVENETEYQPQYDESLDRDPMAYAYAAQSLEDTGLAPGKRNIYKELLDQRFKNYDDSNAAKRQFAVQQMLVSPEFNVGAINSERSYGEGQSTTDINNSQNGGGGGGPKQTFTTKQLMGINGNSSLVADVSDITGKTHSAATQQFRDSSEYKNHLDNIVKSVIAGQGSIKIGNKIYTSKDIGSIDIGKVQSFDYINKNISANPITHQLFSDGSGQANLPAGTTWSSWESVVSQGSASGKQGTASATPNAARNNLMYNSAEMQAKGYTKDPSKGYFYKAKNSTENEWWKPDGNGQYTYYSTHLFGEGPDGKQQK